MKQKEMNRAVYQNDLIKKQKTSSNDALEVRVVKNLLVVQDFQEVLAAQVSHKHPVTSNNFVNVNIK